MMHIKLFPQLGFLYATILTSIFVPPSRFSSLGHPVRAVVANITTPPSAVIFSSVKQVCAFIGTKFEFPSAFFACWNFYSYATLKAIKNNFGLTWRFWNSQFHYSGLLIAFLGTIFTYITFKGGCRNFRKANGAKKCFLLYQIFTPKFIATFSGTRCLPAMLKSTFVSFIAFFANGALSVHKIFYHKTDMGLRNG